MGLTSAHGQHHSSALIPLGNKCSECENRYYIRRKEVIHVNPYVKILNVREINLVAQTFEMELQLTLEWEDANFLEWYRQHEEEFKGPGKDWQAEMRERAWHPSIMLENVAEVHGEKSESWFILEPEGRTNVVAFRTRLAGVFTEAYEQREPNPQSPDPAPPDLEMMSSHLAAGTSSRTSRSTRSSSR